LPNNTGGVALGSDAVFVFGCASGGGLGDPLERDPEKVARDVRRGLISVAAAKDVYGVVFAADWTVDDDVSRAARESIRAARLARAATPHRPMAGKAGEGRSDAALGLTIGIVARAGKRLAHCASCRQLLAEAPRSWKDGAAIAETAIGSATEAFFLAPVAPRRSPAVLLREIFCPACASLLETEVVLEGTPLDDDVRPWFYREVR
jgi:N-methylhydantoinase B